MKNRTSTGYACKKHIAVFVATSLALGMAACGGAASSGAYPAASAAKEEYAYESYDYAAAEEAIAEEEEYAEDAKTVALRAPEKFSEKLVYSGSITIQTLEYDETSGNIHKKIEAAGGFVQNENESNGNTTWYYSGKTSASSRDLYIQARIPAEKFQTFMTSLEEEGQVMNKQVNVENISQTYAETEASAKAYEIEQQRLLDMMDKAETIEDMIAVEARLSEVEKALGVYKTDLASMDRDVTYSTVHIEVEEVREYTEEIDDSTFVSRLRETFRSSWTGFLRFLEGLLHLVIRLLPFMILALLIVLLVRYFDRKYGGSRRMKREAKRQLKRQKKLQKEQAKREKQMARMGAGPPLRPGAQPQKERPQGQRPDTEYTSEGREDEASK